MFSSQNPNRLIIIKTIKWRWSIRLLIVYLHINIQNTNFSSSHDTFHRMLTAETRIFKLKGGCSHITPAFNVSLTILPFDLYKNWYQVKDSNFRSVKIDHDLPQNWTEPLRNQSNPRKHGKSMFKMWMMMIV